MRHRWPALGVIVLAALAHAAAFITYQQKDWHTAWTDQGGYQLLARGIVATGAFTRYPEAPEFVAEALRTPGYPLFVAGVYAVAGDSPMAVVIVQAFVFAALCLVVFLIGRELATERAAIVAAGATALYPMFPYFGALVLTELWTTFVLTAGIYCCLAAIRTRRLAWFIAAGLLVGWASLTRPGFFLLPAFLLVPAVVDAIRAPVRRQALFGWLLCGLAFTAIMAPWFAYNYRHFGVITLSAAGDLGRPVWEASWQGRWNGRTQAALTRLADEAATDEEAAARAQALAAESGLDPEPMREYVHQWRSIRRIWTTPTDPDARVAARIQSTREYLRVGRENIQQNLGGYLRGRLLRALPVLWIGDVPIRHSDIDATPPIVIRAFWAAQAVLMLLALAGAWRLYRDRGAVAALVMVMPLVYVTAVHVPILAEARQSLPVKPLVIALAAIAIISLGTAGRKTSASR